MVRFFSVLALVLVSCASTTQNWSMPPAVLLARDSAMTIKIVEQVILPCSSDDICPLFPIPRTIDVGYGSGVLVGKDRVITAAHVCEKMMNLSPFEISMMVAKKLFLEMFVIDRELKEYKVNTFAYSTEYDICILTTEETVKRLPSRIALNFPLYGSKVWTFGASGTEYGYEILPIFDAYIAGRNQARRIMILTDMAVYPGASGSGVWNAAGELIGMIVAYKVKPGVNGTTHLNNISYAIDLSVIRAIMNHP